MDATKSSATVYPITRGPRSSLDPGQRGRPLCTLQHAPKSIANEQPRIGAKLSGLQLGIRSASRDDSQPRPGTSSRRAAREFKSRPPVRRAPPGAASIRGCSRPPAGTGPVGRESESAQAARGGAQRSNQHSKNRTRRYGFAATRAVHAGARPDPVTGSRNVPIHQTTSYVFDDADHAAALFNLQTFGYIYSRLTNPTVAALEERVAALEGGRPRRRRSGHAAQMLVFFTLLEPGDDVVAARQLYGGSLTQSRHTSAGSAGVEFVDATDPWRSGRDRRADEGDVRRVAGEPRRRSSSTSRRRDDRPRGVHPARRRQHAGDAYLCRPFEWGADIVVHSLTKFLSGHGTSMGGHRRRIRVVRLGGERTVPVPDRSGSRLSRAGLHRDVRRLRVLEKARAVALRDLGPALSPTTPSSS